MTSAPIKRQLGRSGSNHQFDGSGAPDPAAVQAELSGSPAKFAWSTVNWVAEDLVLHCLEGPARENLPGAPDRDRPPTLIRAELQHAGRDGRPLGAAPSEMCISRLHEVTNVKHESKQIELEHNKLVLHNTADDLGMPAQSALQVQEALKRRGLAYAFAQALSFSEYDRYLTKLFGHVGILRLATI